MPGPSKHRETYVYPVYQRISKIIRWQPDSNTSTQPQGANKDRPAILNPDDYDNLPLDDPPEDKEDRRRWHHMEVVPHPTQEKYFKSEIVVAIVKCVALAITLLGVTLILIVNPTQVVCQYPRISPWMNKADIAMNSASQEMDLNETDKVITNQLTKFQDNEETPALTEEILSEQVTPNVALDDLTLSSG